MNKQNSGFTIVELMIATAVFSVVLLLCATGMIQIGRMYYKGVTLTQTQETARSVIDEISRAIQFGGGKVISTPGLVCVDTQRFTYITGRQVSDNPTGSKVKNALVVDTNPTCSAPSPNIDNAAYTLPAGARQLVPPNMRIGYFNVEDKGDGLWKITVRIAYGDDDLLNAAYDRCTGPRVATQFCAISELSTTVKKRI